MSDPHQSEKRKGKGKEAEDSVGGDDKTTKTSSSSSRVFSYSIVVLVVLLAVLLNTRSDLQIGERNATATQESSRGEVSSSSPSGKPKYVLYNASGRKDHLKHVEIVLQRFGYEETPFNASSTDWTLMWAHDYPYNTIKTIDFKNLEPCQRVNHIPGCGFITNKVDLSTTRLKYIPRAFKLPEQQEELLEFSRDNPDKLFVHKHNQHRHIKVRPLQEIDFQDQNNFVQEFIDNPLLVDGFKFDIGVYTIITSVDPLRVYYYSGDILFRFCPVQYYPFDGENVDKYIVGDDYLPIWKVPSLSVSYNQLKHGMKDSFDIYMRSKGRDPQRIWDQIEESIRLMMHEKEKHLIGILKRYKNKRNFFELMRFDFVVDNDLNVFMMEANMSPNLSAAHFPPNQLLYEQVLYNGLKMAGIAFPQQNGSCSGSMGVNQMMASDKNIVVNGDKCATDCLGTCTPEEVCGLCYSCLTATKKQLLYDAVSERINQGDTTRVVPAPTKILRSLSDNDWQQMSSSNRFMSRWYLAKCESNPSWC